MNHDIYKPRRITSHFFTGKNLSKKILRKDSSIVKWGYQDNFKLVYFFLRKDFARTKHSQANINQQNKIKETLNNKVNSFSRAQTYKSLKVTCFAFECFLCARNLFVKIKTKKKQAWNCLDNLISLYYWCLPLSTHLSSVYLYAFVFICNHLWESFLFVIICKNLFFKVFMKISKRMNTTM